MILRKKLIRYRYLILALGTIILVSMLWVISTGKDIKRDKSIPKVLTNDLAALGNAGPDFEFSKLVGPAPAHMKEKDLQAGKFQLRANGRIWNFSLPINWAADPFNDLNWRYELNKLVMIDPYLAKFEKEQDKDAFRSAVAIILDWQDFHQIKQQQSSVSWLDMVSGQRAARLAYVIGQAELQPDLLNKELMQRLISLSDFHVKRMQGPGFMPDDNHGIFDALGLTALCQTLDELAACSEAEAKARRRMREIFFLQFAKDGGHKEHSPLYHFFAVYAFNQVFATGLFDDDEQINKRRKLAAGLQPWFLDATGRSPAIGDSERTIAYVGAGLNCAPSVQSCTKTRLLDKSGYGIVKTVSANKEQQSSLIMTCSFHSYIHKHLDELSFEWAENGNLILVDSGKYAYDQNSMRSYMLSRKAHNTVSFAKEKFLLNKKQFPGNCMVSLDAEQYPIKLQGEYQISGTQILHERRIEYTPGDQLRVKDHFSGNDGEVPVAFWHFAPGFTLTKQDAFTVIATSTLQTVRAKLMTEKCRIEIKSGQKLPTHQGWVSTGYRKAVAASVIIATCPAGTKKIETVFQMQAPRSPPEIIEIFANE